VLTLEHEPASGELLAHPDTKLLVHAAVARWPIADPPLAGATPLGIIRNHVPRLPVNPIGVRELAVCHLIPPLR
jgi:hypothetical protein